MAKLFDIIERPTSLDIIDPSKLTTFKDCPRKFFYEHVLGWKTDYPNNHLVFGTAWHFAMEHLLLEGYSTQSVEEAKFLFMHAYRRELPPESDELYGPKRPANALLAIDDYARRFSTDPHTYDILHTEIGGTVLTSPDDPEFFKIDAILRDKISGKYLILDHKTSQRKSNNWASGWQLSTQILTYIHVLHCLYPREEVYGGIVRGSFFYETKSAGPRAEFDEAMIEKNPTQMQAWVESNYHWVQELKYELQKLEEQDDSQVTLGCFPQNDNSCTKYYGCPFLDICPVWTNPLRNAQNPPIGFRIEHWDPREKESIRERVDLTQITPTA